MSSSVLPASGGIRRPCPRPARRCHRCSSALRPEPRKRRTRTERVAERCVPQVADMRRLVGIDRRVLDDGLAAGSLRATPVRPRSAVRAGTPSARGRSSDTVRCRGDARDAVERAEVPRRLLRNRPWRLAEPARQFERHGAPRSPRSRLGGSRGAAVAVPRDRANNASSAAPRGAREFGREQAGSSVSGEWRLVSRGRDRRDVVRFSGPRSGRQVLLSCAKLRILPYE